ncbi:uncharacterized protein V1516DRAFT_627679 [Lipomyces oligophaga]|uniref:uncharacterized protein n=1 Tax=Lipomyces oligophaga TaxID=45792 RepID=UPI0034CDFBDD
MLPSDTSSAQRSVSRVKTRSVSKTSTGPDKSVLDIKSSSQPTLPSRTRSVTAVLRSISRREVKEKKVENLTPTQSGPVKRSVSTAKNYRSRTPSSSTPQRSQSRATVKPIREKKASYDPFNLLSKSGTSKEILKKIQASRRTGVLDMSLAKLSELPEEMFYFLSLPEGADLKHKSLTPLRELTASKNSLEVLDDRFADQFDSLINIDLQYNNLRKLPVNLKKLENLTMLNLSNNKLPTECFKALCGLIGLVNLDLHNNHLDGEIPEYFAGMTSLQSVDLSKNDISSINEAAFSGLISLKKIDLSSNRLKSFPFMSVERLPVQEINLSYNKISGSLISTARISRFSDLQILRANHNRIEVVSEFAIILPVLEVLDLYSNSIASLGMLLICTPSLTTLLLGRNIMPKLPEGVTGLANLKTLDMTHNQLTELDSELGLIDSLELLKWEGNKFVEKSLTYLTTKDIKFRLRARLEQEQGVSVESGSPEQDSSEELAELILLQQAAKSQARAAAGATVDLSGRNYREIPESILDHYRPGGIYRYGSEAVRELLLQRNMFNTIPGSIQDFAFADALETIDLSSNQLGDYGFDTPISLRSVTNLNLSGNSISSLYMFVANFQLPCLARLDLSFNKLDDIPQSLVKVFTNLEELNLHENKLIEIDVDALKGLAKIDISNNSISYLPPELSLIKTIVELKVAGNTFKNPRPHVVQKGTEAILDWLKLRLPEDDSME